MRPTAPPSGSSSRPGRGVLQYARTQYARTRATASGPPAASAVDLHAHTTASDGALTPPRLVALAVARGLRVLGVTDHDTVAGVDEAVGAAAGSGLRVIPGVELSAHVAAGEVHVLGYFVDRRAPGLLDAL